MTSQLIGKPSVWWSSHEESQRGQALFPNISVNVATDFLDKLAYIHRIKILHREIINGNVHGKIHCPTAPTAPISLNQLNVNGFRLSIYLRLELEIGGVSVRKYCCLIMESKSYLRQYRRRRVGGITPGLRFGLQINIQYQTILMELSHTISLNSLSLTSTRMKQRHPHFS